MATIDSWPAFAAAVGAAPRRLLATAQAYPAAVFVTGCQRSGTTMLARLLMQSQGFAPYRITHDNELDAALLLCGLDTLPPEGGRRCFQTTYLNQHWPEYASLRDDQRVIWVLRRPDSVVWSMVYHWKPFARAQLYRACGQPLEADYAAHWAAAGHWARWRYRRTWQACLSYIGKSRQLDGLAGLLGERLKVVDYDDLVSDPQVQLPRLYAFLGMPFDAAAATTVQPSRLQHARRLKACERHWVEQLCVPVYRELRTRYLA